MGPHTFSRGLHTWGILAIPKFPDPPHDGVSQINPGAPCPNFVQTAVPTRLGTDGFYKPDWYRRLVHVHLLDAAGYHSRISAAGFFSQLQSTKPDS